jgi:hypothetical protein
VQEVRVRPLELGEAYGNEDDEGRDWEICAPKRDRVLVRDLERGMGTRLMSR